ncbi:Glycine-rich RNA-binding, abscisic acid-inducible protein [Arachis hypogaea]|nr:Glycine-rich RNA-binding, abscisic acid-inducible protein [Arachis hypogaea]
MGVERYKKEGGRRSTNATRSCRCHHLLGLPLRALSSPSFIRILLSPSHRRRYLDISKAAANVEFRCFVGGFAWATDNKALEKAFSAYGEIVESKVRRSDAIDGMNGSNLDGCNITVNEAQSYRGGGGGGFRSGGGGGRYGGRAIIKVDTTETVVAAVTKKKLIITCRALNRLTGRTATSAGIAIGSEMSGGVSEVHAQNIRFFDSYSAIRIKTSPGRGGYVRNVFVSNMTLENVDIAISYSWNYSNVQGYFDFVSPKLASLSRREYSQSIVQTVTICPITCKVQIIKQEDKFQVTYNVELGVADLVVVHLRKDTERDDCFL